MGKTERGKKMCQVILLENSLASTLRQKYTTKCKGSVSGSNREGGYKTSKEEVKVGPGF